MIASKIAKAEKVNKPLDVNVAIGDKVKVHIKIKEGDKERIQVFAGTVIAKGGSGTNKTFTVRRIAAHGVGVEKVFALTSPNLAKVDIESGSKVRRSKLYFLRSLSGKKARLKSIRKAPVKK